MAEERQVIITPYARLSFPSLANATAFKRGDPERFLATLLFPKPDVVKGTRDDGKPISPWGDIAVHDLTGLRTIIDQYVEECWPNAKKRPAGLKLPFLDGDTKPWDGYEGQFFIRTKSKRPPKLFDSHKVEITGEDIERVFYAGAWVRAVVNTYDYNQQGNVGVNFGLQAVQFIRDDDPFTGGVSADSFDDLPEGDLAPDDLDDLD